MSPENTPAVVIPLSKAKLVLTSLGAIAFVVLGGWLWTIAETQTRHDPFFVRCVAVACIGFFGLCGIYSCLKLFDGKPGLIIDAEGIDDNSSGVAAGRIAWSEIVGLRVSTIMRQEFLTIEVCDPHKYVVRGGPLKRLLNAANYQFAGSPINIASNVLQIDFDELVSILHEALARHRDTMQSDVNG